MTRALRLIPEALFVAAFFAAMWWGLILAAAVAAPSV